MNNVMSAARRCSRSLRRLALASVALLAGCALIHHDTGPVGQFDAGRVRLPPQLDLPAGAWPSAGWWRQFDDPQLSGFIERALSGSPTIALARERVANARSQTELAVAVSGLHLNATAAIDREHVSSHGFLSAYAGRDAAIGADGPWYTTGLAGFDGAWDIDIWGRHRAQIAAAMGIENARKAEDAEIALELSTDIARVYYQVQTALASRALLEREKGAVAIEVDAHQSRFGRGLEPDTLAKEAQTKLLSVDQQIAQTSEQIDNGQESLRALIGADPGERLVVAPRPLPVAETGIPPSLGFQLLARRPDLQALRWYVVASLKQVDAAKAAFYPSFDIKAFFGFNALDLSQLFLHASQQINIVPGLNLPVFDSGRLNAELHGARALSNAGILRYNQAVLNAVRDVAQTGRALRDLNERAAMQKEKLADVQFVFDSVSAQYERGLADKVQVEQAREARIDAQLAMLRLTSQGLQTSIALTKTLGGGYRAPADAHASGP